MNENYRNGNLLGKYSACPLLVHISLFGWLVNLTKKKDCHKLLNLTKCIDYQTTRTIKCLINQSQMIIVKKSKIEKLYIYIYIYIILYINVCIL